MGDSVAPPPCFPFPAPGTEIVPGRMPTSGGRGLIPAVKLSYAAPGAAYQGLHIDHISGCRIESLFFTAEVRAIVAHLDLRSSDSVESLGTAIMAARGWCISGDTSFACCHVDRTTTLGVYTRFHSPEGSSQSFAPSSSQVVSSDFHSTMASDPMVPSASGASIDEHRSQHPMYVPSVVEVDDSQRRLPSPVERLSSGERMLYNNFRLDRSSDEDYAPPAGSICPESRITQVSSPPPIIPPCLRPGAGSGFAPDSTIPSHGRAFVPVSKRHHEFIAHTKEGRGNTLSKRDSPSPLPLTTSQVVPSLAVIVRDTPMDLGSGSNTDGTGIGDARYATDAQPQPAPRSLSPTFSSLPALPLTMSYRSP